MYVTNDTDIPILYTILGGIVGHGTILPGRGQEIESTAALAVSFATDDGTPLPATLAVTLERFARV
jgi:hypothetical protein